MPVGNYEGHTYRVGTERVYKTPYGKRALYIPTADATIYDEDSADLTSRGNRYTFFHFPKGYGESNAEPGSRFYFGMDTESGPRGEAYAIEIPKTGTPDILYRDGTGSVTSIADTATGSLEWDNMQVVTLRWDDGTLGGANGDIAVEVYHRVDGRKLASASGTHTARTSGTIGWGTPPGSAGSGLFDYLREGGWTPGPELTGTVLDSFEDGDMSEYSPIYGPSQDTFTVTNTEYATDGEYAAETIGSGQYYRPGSNTPISKGHFYLCDLYRYPNDGEYSRFELYLATQQGTKTDTDCYRLIAHEDNTVYMSYTELNTPEFFGTQTGGPGMAKRHRMTFQSYWDDGTLGGSDGDMGIEVFKWRTGELLTGVHGNTSAISASGKPTSGDFGLGSDHREFPTSAADDPRGGPTFVDNLRKATKPTFESPDTPPGK